MQPFYLLVIQLDKLALKSQEVLQDAQRIAREASHHKMDGEHLLLAPRYRSFLFVERLPVLGKNGGLYRPAVDRVDKRVVE